MAVPKEEIAVPTFDINEEKSTARRVFKIDWSDMDEFLEELYLPGDLPNWAVLPATFPGHPALLVKTVNIQAFDGEALGANDAYGVATPCSSQVKATINYETRPTKPPGSGGEQISNTEFSAVGSQQVIPYSSNAAWEWEHPDATGHKTVKEDALPEGFPVNIIDWSMRRNNVYSPNWSLIHRLLGCLNSALFIGYPIETVLYKGFNLGQGQHGLTNETVWNFDFQFSVRLIQITDSATGMTTVVGWNHFLQTNPGPSGVIANIDTAWQRIVKKNPGADDTEYVFPLANLNALFQVG